MDSSRTVTDVLDAVGHAKSGARAYTSNLFAAPERIERWIAHRELSWERYRGAAVFWRQDRGFSHLYFCAASPLHLEQALTACPAVATEPMVVDLVGLEADVDAVASVFARVGFAPFMRLVRMARTGPASERPAESPDPRVIPAGADDVDAIHDLLLRSFDCRAEQVPHPYEIEAAVAAGQIQVVRGDGRLAGLLFSETHGLTSTLRYWLVAPQCRAIRVGSALMRCYFSAHPDVRRFFLWVIDRNVNALAKYEHYGYAPDGLIDRVFANKGITR